jgi:crossover junction endodeoxyribonuclease RusA
VELVIVLPLPHADLSPNARTHWRRKAQQVKQYRTRAYLEARSLLPHDWTPLTEATLYCRFYFGTRRRRDADNLLASMKAAFDGLRDAGVVQDDSQFTHWPVSMLLDKFQPRVEVQVLAGVR